MEENNVNVEKQKKFKLRMPHTFVLLFCIAIVAGTFNLCYPGRLV